MAFFDFLKDTNTEKEAAKKVFRFLGRSGPTTQGVIKEAVTVNRDKIRPVAIDVARSTAKIPETVGRSYAQAKTKGARKAAGLPDDFDLSSGPVKDPIRRFAYGEGSVETYQKRAKGNKEKLEKTPFKSVAGPLSFLGLVATVGSDVTGVPGKKQLTETLAKEVTEQGVKRALKKAGKDISDDAIRAIANTKDRNVINKIVEQSSPSPTTITQPLPELVPPAPVRTPTSPVGQGSATDIIDATIPRTRQRGFLESAKESPALSDETKQAIGNINPQTYDQRANPELYERAKSIVDENPEAALARVRGTTPDSLANIDEDVAISTELLRRANTEGRFDDAARLVDEMTEKATSLGRGVQAHALIGRLTPEGILKLASRKIRKAREATKGGVFKKGVDEEAKVAKELKDSFETGVKVNSKLVNRAVEEASTGERVAKKVEAAVAPKVKKKADQLVDEISKKIRQEMLTPLPAAKKKSPTAILREVFGRNKEAQEAFPEAQRILRERFADNAQAQKALDKFFSSELGLPAASTTINSAIREQLVKNQAKISGIIQKSWAGQKQSVDDVAAALTKEGFDAESAKTIAKEVTDRLNAQVSAAKKSTLERMAKEAPKSAKATFEDKIAKLSNLGALDDQDYLDLARGKLKLPSLSPELAGDLSKLAQKMQDLADNDPQKFRIIQEIGEKIAGSVSKTAQEKIWEVFGAPRSALTSFDISGMGRQGFALGTRYLKEFGRSFKTQVKYFANEENFKQGMAEIAVKPDFKLKVEKMKLALTGAVQKPEEVFSSPVLEAAEKKLFGKYGPIAASNRGYTGGLTKFRDDVSDTILKNLRDAGIEPNSLPDKHLEDLGWYINIFSGRGGKPGGWLEKHGSELSKGLFSPQLWASRLRILDPTMVFRLKGPAKKLYLQNMGSLAGVVAPVLGLAAIAGAEVETDARSADFLKIKIGDTRYDILGGLQQNLVAAHRLLKGEKKNSQSGAITKLSGKDKSYGGDTRFDVLFDLIENKENPIVATGSRLLRGEDRAGQPVNLKDEALGLVAPLAVRETVEQGIKEGPLGVAKSLPGYVGVGTQSYGLEDINLTDKQKAKVEGIKDSKQKEAYASFYQTAKVASGRRKNVLDEIKKVIATDEERAIKLAQEYNAQYASAFKDWKSKNKQYADDELTKEYASNKITDATLERIIKSLEEDE